MGAAHYFPRHSTLPVLNWLGGRAPKAYLRIERSTSKLAAAVEAVDDEDALSAGDAVREADIDAAKSSGNIDIFVRDESASAAAQSPRNSAVEESNEFGDSDEALEALKSLSIDDLRELASSLQVHDRSKITEKQELIDEICKRL